MSTAQDMAPAVAVNDDNRGAINDDTKGAVNDDTRGAVSDDTRGVNPQEKPKITISAETFIYSFKIVETAHGEVFAKKNKTLRNDYAQLLGLQSLMADQRKRLDGHLMVTDKPEEEAWGDRLDSEMTRLQSRLHEWLWELENIDQEVCIDAWKTLFGV
ncbi:MAG: hypothetical protein Q9221_004759 [Calogaya cf. arnoldii]